MINLRLFSLSKTNIGHMVLIGLLYCSSLFAGDAPLLKDPISPKSCAKLFIWLFVSIPVPGIVTPDPKEKPRV